MNNMHKFRSLVLFIAVIIMVSNSNAQNKLQLVTAKFSNPDKPGKIILNWPLGGVVISVHNRNDVTLSISTKPEPSGEDIRILKQAAVTYSSPVEVSEEDNIITVKSYNQNKYYDIEMKVPGNISLQVLNQYGSINIHGVAGELDLKSRFGSMLLEEITGPVTASTQYGKITAYLTDIKHDKPMSFSSFYDDIELYFFENANITFNLKTENQIATNFSPDKLIQVTGDEIRKINEALIQAGKITISEGVWQGKTTEIDIDKINFVKSGAQNTRYNLNGGGVFIEVRSVHGDIYVKKRNK